MCIQLILSLRQFSRNFLLAVHATQKLQFGDEFLWWWKNIQTGPGLNFLRVEDIHRAKIYTVICSIITMKHKKPLRMQVR